MKEYVQYLTMVVEVVDCDRIIHGFALKVVEDHFVDRDFATIMVWEHAGA